MESAYKQTLSIFHPYIYDIPPTQNAHPLPILAVCRHSFRRVPLKNHSSRPGCKARAPNTRRTRSQSTTVGSANARTCIQSTPIYIYVFIYIDATPRGMCCTAWWRVLCLKNARVFCMHIFSQMTVDFPLPTLRVPLLGDVLIGACHAHSDGGCVCLVAIPKNIAGVPKTICLHLFVIAFNQWLV